MALEFPKAFRHRITGEWTTVDSVPSLENVKVKNGFFRVDLSKYCINLNISNLFHFIHQFLSLDFQAFTTIQKHVIINTMLKERLLISCEKDHSVEEIRDYYLVHEEYTKDNVAIIVSKFIDLEFQKLLPFQQSIIINTLVHFGVLCVYDKMNQAIETESPKDFFGIETESPNIHIKSDYELYMEELENKLKNLKKNG